MSFLLDALKKSETRQRRGEVPGLHTAVAEPRRAKRRWPLLVLVLVLPLAIALVWQTWQYRGDDAKPLVGAGTAEEKNISRSETQAEGAGRDTDALTTPLSVPRPAAGLRTPVEDFVPEAVAQAAAEPEAEPEPIPDAVERLAVDSNSAGESAEADDAPDPAVQPPQVRQAPPVVDREDNLGLVEHWQLPESVRSDLPELKISVLVFAPVPDDRFVLLNGRRQVEGDEPHPGLEIEEIRREGVVFRYRHYRFLVSQ